MDTLRVVMIVVLIGLVLVHAYNCFFKYKTWATTTGGRLIQCCGFACWIIGIVTTMKFGWVGCVVFYAIGWLLLHGPEIAEETKRQISGGKYKAKQVGSTTGSSGTRPTNRAQRRRQSKK